MHPFMSYEVAMGVVGEALAVSERSWWFRRRDEAEGPSLPSADSELAALLEQDLERVETVDTRV